MKLIALPVLLIAFYATAQEPVSEPDLAKLQPKRLVSKIEFLAGPSIIYPYGNEGFEKARVGKLGFAANVGLIHNINSRLAINLKFRYENKGSKTIAYSPNIPPPDSQKSILDVTLKYATFSLLPCYSIWKEREFYIGFGPYFGYLNSVKTSIEVYMNGILSGQSTSSPDPYLFNKAFDVGLTTVIGYNVHINQKTECSVQFLHNLGLVYLSKDTTYPVRNNTFSLLLGFSINKNSYVKL
ncbi:MAG: outer membrane beta-barrel protein [Bacteroidota bacterium]